MWCLSLCLKTRIRQNVIHLFGLKIGVEGEKFLYHISFKIFPINRI